ncbi:MAG: transglycosylase SLT domain-containing protein [Verrucomicrobiales bacterium]|nr:transglycosylase SLT domain-containing protein [Verrucomicrobiales bacterium]
MVGVAPAGFGQTEEELRREEDLRRERAIAEFTQRMKEANYPALFEKAAAEFNVPPDILTGVAFAETRWEHLTWPEGQNADPCSGMPRPYGIMSLWSNEFFGYSLLEAAKLIGKDPDELKRDPFQNMRGAAALLRKLYDENPKPEGTTEADIESWRYAIAEYCGIPDRDLKHLHALEVFEFINRGYHQYGIEWDGRPVNLEPMRAEVRRILAEEQQKLQAMAVTNPRLRDVPMPQVPPDAASAAVRPPGAEPGRTPPNLPGSDATPEMAVAVSRPTYPGIAILALAGAGIAGLIVAHLVTRRSHGSRKG